MPMNNKASITLVSLCFVGFIVWTSIRLWPRDMLDDVIAACRELDEMSWPIEDVFLETNEFRYVTEHLDQFLSADKLNSIRSSALNAFVFYAALRTHSDERILQAFDVVTETRPDAKVKLQVIFGIVDYLSSTQCVELLVRADYENRMSFFVDFFSTALEIQEKQVITHRYSMNYRLTKTWVAKNTSLLCVFIYCTKIPIEGKKRNALS